MGTDAEIDQVKKELLRAFDNTRAELDRIEILAAGLAAFNTPIPQLRADVPASPPVEPERARARLGRAENLSFPKKLGRCRSDASE